MPKFTKEQIRQKLMDRKRRMQKLEIELPDLEELNGELALQELTLGDFEDAENLWKDQDGNSDPMLESCTVIARSLVTYATKERILADEDSEWMKREWGNSIVSLISKAIEEFSGRGENAYENAKKNYLSHQRNDLAIFSENNLVATGHVTK